MPKLQSKIKGTPKYNFLLIPDTKSNTYPLCFLFHEFHYQSGTASGGIDRTQFYSYKIKQPPVTVTNKPPVYPALPADG